MALFVGTAINKVDRKGRVSVPAPFRAELSSQGFGGVYLFPSHKYAALEGCDGDFMQRLSRGLEDMNLFSEEQDDLAATIFADVVQLTWDTDGRIVLPADLMKHAGISERAAFVGQGPRFQVWEPGAFDDHRATARARTRERQLTAPLGRDGGGA